MNSIIASSVIPMLGIAIFLAALVVGDTLGMAVEKLVKSIKGTTQHEDRGH